MCHAFNQAARSPVTPQIRIFKQAQRKPGSPWRGCEMNRSSRHPAPSREPANSAATAFPRGPETAATPHVGRRRIQKRRRSRADPPDRATMPAPPRGTRAATKSTGATPRSRWTRFLTRTLRERREVVHALKCPIQVERTAARQNDPASAINPRRNSATGKGNSARPLRPSE